MICPVCKGSRAVYRKVENIVTLTHCPKCNGVGEVEDPTNEQWFNSLSTKEKARFLVGAIKDCGWCLDGGQPRKWSFCGDSMESCPAESVEKMEQWLKEKHVEQA